MHAPTDPLEYSKKSGISCRSTDDTTSQTILEIRLQIQTKSTI